jgi:hypothetical protein
MRDGDWFDCRWWAVAIPSLAVITLVYIFAALQGYNRAVTPSFDRLECITGILSIDVVDNRFIRKSHD